MSVHAAHPQGWMQIIIPLAIFAVIMAIRAPRLMRVRPLHADRLWIVPAIYLVFVGALFVSRPPSPLGWAVAAAGLVAGAALGWQRGKTLRIIVDPRTHALQQKGSIWAILFIVVLFAIKTLSQTEGGALHFDVDLLLDGLAALSFGMFTVQRVEMYLRAKTLLAAARA